MIGDIGVHGADDADVIDVLSGVMENFADFQARLPVLAELERRGESRSGAPLGAQVAGRERFACVFLKHGFGVEGIHVARSAIGKDVNDVLGFRGEVGLFRRQGIDGSLGGGR